MSTTTYIPDFYVSGTMKMDQGWPLLLIGGLPALATAALGWLGGKRQSRDTREMALWTQAQKLRDDMFQEIGQLKGVNAEQEKRFAAMEEKNDLEQKVRHELRGQLHAALMELEVANRTIRSLQETMQTASSTTPVLMVPKGAMAVSTSRSETHIEPEKP